MNYLRAIAGVACGVSAIILIIQKEYALAGTLLGTMMGFFVGEANGKRLKENSETVG